MYFLILRTFVLSMFLISVNSATCPALKLKNGRVRKMSGGRIVRFNCMREFQLVGVKYSPCLKGKWENDLPICVKPGCPRVQKNVNGQFLESYRGAVVKVLCNPGYTLLGSPSVYCNGSKWNETFPSCLVTNTDPAMECDFESENICGWSQDPTHDFDWKRQNRSTVVPDSKTNLYTKSGIVMHVDPQIPREGDEVARLYSPVYSAQQSLNACFSFWFHIKGLASHLKVYVKLEGRELSSTIPSAWIMGPREDDWQMDLFNIEPTKVPFQIVLEGVCGKGFGNDIAFDDVRLAYGSDCVVAMASTTTAPEVSETPSDDIKDLLSCNKRCNEEPYFIGFNLTAEDETMTPSCDCHAACVSNSTCCNDYDLFCTSGSYTDVKSMSTSTRLPVSSTKTTRKPSMSSTTTKTTSTMKPTTKTTSTSKTTTKTTSTMKPNTKTTTNEKKQEELTKEKQNKKTKQENEVLPIKAGLDQSGPFNKQDGVTPHFTTPLSVPLVVNPSKQILNSKPTKIAPVLGSSEAVKSDENQFTVKSIVGLVGSLAAVLTTLISFTFLLVRRKKQQLGVEDTEVRYLTSDEHLDIPTKMSPKPKRPSQTSFIQKMNTKYKQRKEEKEDERERIDMSCDEYFDFTLAKPSSDNAPLL